MSLETKALRRLFVELLVVVFGILIAFAVDRWNQDRQDRATAAQYAEALAEDLAADTAALGMLARLYAGREAAATRVLDALGRTSAFEGDPTALAWDINYAGYVTSFDPTDITYRELVSTGALGLIHEPGLKHALVAYYESVDFVAQFYPIWHETARVYYKPEVRSRVSLADWIAIETSVGQGEDKPVAPDATLDALRQSGLSQKLLTSMLISLTQQASSHESLREAAIDLMALLPAPAR